MAYDQRRMQDIKYTEKSLLETYQAMWQESDFDGINNLLQNNLDLKYKLFDSFNWNRLTNLVNDRMAQNVDIPQWESEIVRNRNELVAYAGYIWVSNVDNNSTLPSFIVVGMWDILAPIANAQGGDIAWESARTYSLYDMVAYAGYIWVSKQSQNSNNVPRLGSLYWQQIYSTDVLKYATYDSLVGKWQIDYARLKNITDEFKYVGEWEAKKTYRVGNLVNIDEYNSYFCIENNVGTVGNKPPNSTYWRPAQTMLASVGLQVSSTFPTNLSVGDIFLKTIN